MISTTKKTARVMTVAARMGVPLEGPGRKNVEAEPTSRTSHGVYPSLRTTRPTTGDGRTMTLNASPHPLRCAGPATHGLQEPMLIRPLLPILDRSGGI